MLHASMQRNVINCAPTRYHGPPQNNIIDIVLLTIRENLRNEVVDVRSENCLEIDALQISIFRRKLLDSESLLKELV